MSGITVSYRLEPRRSPPAVRATPPKAKRTAPRRGERTAMMLALAHHIERLVDDGVLADYAAAARKLGLTSARMTQVMNLLLLAPGIQESLLVGGRNTRERFVRAALRYAEWNHQRAALGT